MWAEFWSKKQSESTYSLLYILPFVVCLLIRLLPFSLKFMVLSFSALLLCLLISSKSDASKYSSSCMISNARPYLREKKEDTFFQSGKIFFSNFCALLRIYEYMYSRMLLSDQNFGKVLAGIFEVFCHRLQNSNRTSLTLIGMREGSWPFWIRFFSWIFIKNFQTFLEVKIGINRVNLTPCQAHFVF